MAPAWRMYLSLGGGDRQLLLVELENLRNPPVNEEAAHIRLATPGRGENEVLVALAIGDDLWAFIEVNAGQPGLPARFRVINIWNAPTSSVHYHAPQPSAAARRATELAARMAGNRRPHLREEWAALLEGDPDREAGLTSRQELALVMGLLLAALRMRVRDGVRPAWRPVDWVLRLPSRTNAFITMLVGTQAIFIVGDDGLTALVSQAWEPCGIAGASLFALARWLRRVRGIELATPETERANE
ncbi:hypothetical protein [Streptomyces sp. WAC01526]|uniref:hypothetical protein n=1 Tax=Streptomyces sp. WAC01526 TaxID=2588709 RepID=UPI0011DFD3F6|nr:hypothetical protein [Streptomyces sp. WAC01526]